MRYFRPTSLTWWAGIFAIAIGVLIMSGAGQWSNEIGMVIATLAGGADASPAGLITLGLGLIGVRDVLARAYGAV